MEDLLAPPLQAQPTPLLNQEEALETIRRRLTSDEVRLLTLTGPVGVGKTRLALEAGLLLTDEFADGITLVDLTPVRDSSRVLPAIAEALGVAERDGSSLLEQIVQHLSDQKRLLILDVFERVLPAAAQLVDLLKLATGVTFLVTSRVPLHLRWEQTLRVPPLAVPDLVHIPVLAALAQIPAVALFLQRTQAINPDFEMTEENARSVAELVVHLDGLPLAIELAAARTPALSPQMIVDRLESRLSLLRWQTPDLPEYQRSLDSAIGWSYELLTPEDRALFRSVGVFVGGFDLEAAEAVQGRGVGRPVDVLEGLASLVDKSLIQVTGQGDARVRYSVLECIREYALGQLESADELDAARRAHTQHFLALAERADPLLRTNEQGAWFSRLEQEEENLYAALEWSRDHAGHETGLRLSSALGYFWWARGRMREGCQWLEEMLINAPDADPVVRARGLLWLGAMLTYRGNLASAQSALQSALTLAKENHDPSAIAECLTYLGNQALHAGESEKSIRLLREALDAWAALGDRADQHNVAVTLYYLGLSTFVQHDYEFSASLLSNAVAVYDAIGDTLTASVTRLCLALTVLQMGDAPRAVNLVRRSLHECMHLSSTWCLVLGVDATMMILGDRIDPDERDRLLGAREAMRQAEGFTHSFWDQWIVERLSTLPTLADEVRSGTAFQQGRHLTASEIVALAATVLERFAQSLDASEAEEKVAPDTNPLSGREMEVLQLVSEGLSSRLIGKQLFISASTVNYHLTSIFNKLGVDTRAQAVAVAARRRML